MIICIWIWARREVAAKALERGRHFPHIKIMHILAFILSVTIGATVWYFRLARNTKNITDATTKIKNYPRQKAFKETYHTRGFDLVKTPLEAATVMMISTAKMGRVKGVSPTEHATINDQLFRQMQLSKGDADGLNLSMQSVVHDIVLPESALFPMVNILRDFIDREDAIQLAEMMQNVAQCEGEITPAQADFLRRYKERMGLLG